MTIYDAENKIKQLLKELNERECMFTEKETECHRLKKQNKKLKLTVKLF